MAVINLVPGVTAVEGLISLAPLNNTPSVVDAPGGLYPLMSAGWDMDEYRILNGWPVEIPKYDIRANSLITMEGDVLSGRDDPNNVETGAFIRWIADPVFYDEEALLWRPAAGPSDLVWETSTDYAPVLIDNYEYRVAEEKFFMYAMNFDSDTANHMWCDFSSVLSGVNGYTVILVMSPNSAFGNNVDVPYNGLWCPGRPTLAGPTFSETIADSWMGVTLQGNYLYLETESMARTKTVALAPQLNATAPSYLVFSFSRPQTTIYVANGPTNIISKTISVGTEPGGMDSGVVLGRSTGDVLHTADMALFDVGLYGSILTPAQIKDEIALLSRAYGGDK